MKRLDKKVSVFDKNEWLFGCKIFVIGNRLAKIAKEMGWNDIVVSDNANNNDLLKLISKTNDRN